MAEISKYFTILFSFIILGGCFYNPPIIITKDSNIIQKNNNIKSQKFDNNFKIEKAREDPFVSFFKTDFVEIPASQIVLNRRLAPYQFNLNSYDAKKIPLPNLKRRLSGIMFNDGKISAILETQFNNQIFYDYVTPGSRVISGSDLIPYLTVSYITKNHLVLESNDGRSVKVYLSNSSL